MTIVEFVTVWLTDYWWIKLLILSLGIVFFVLYAIANSVSIQEGSSDT